MKPPVIIHVLLVEDNPTDVLLTREVLESQLQFHLTHVERLGDALSAMAVGPYDVILLDLGLPDSQGLETLLAVRQQAPDLPIVVMTGRDDEELALRAVGEGAQDYLVKSQVRDSILSRAIRYAVERKRSMQALLEKE